MVAIRNTSGEIIASGDHLSVRDLLVELVQKRVQLTKADLSDLDLSGLDLSGALLREAKLDRADLRQSRLDGVVLRGASLCNAAFQGAQMREAILEGVLADGANFTGAGLRQAWLIDARGDKARFEDADLAGADMTGARFYGCHFQRSTLVDTRFVDAKFYGNDFREADLRSTDDGLPGGARPDRSLGSRVVGNKFSSSPKLCETLGAFRRDTWLGWTANKAAIGLAGGVGSLAALALVPNLVDAKVGLGLLTSPLPFVVMVGAPLLVRAIVGGRIKDMAEPHVEALVQGVAKVLDRAAKAGTAVSDIVGLIWSGGANALEKAVLATREKAGAVGWGAAFGRLSLGSAKLVFCDRRHFALALQELSRPRIPGSRGEAETILVRDMEGPAGTAPQALRLHADGAVTAVYGKGSVTWGVHGDPVVVGEVPEGQPIPDWGSSAKLDFEAAIFEDHGVEPITKHWFVNHFEAARDGSLIVVDHVSRQVSNLAGPAVLRPDDKIEWIVDGKVWNGGVDEKRWPLTDARKDDIDDDAPMVAMPGAR